MENKKKIVYERFSMKEYTIFIQNGTCPQYAATNRYKTFQEAYMKLMEMVQLERERKRPYYVDYQEFKNEYTNAVNGKCFTIKEREYTEWKPYKSINELQGLDENTEKQKIKYILNFI